ncbi:SDR family NAD(P)-dependent oxidoreductase [Marinibaculum pumilum]|uniref:SDR family NAD(P)-dependent oxidoreductase n=1 Tax=Marinibaculum pumilum TaxID=1766165 RepID=A0ABV7KXT1_9PROT
MQIEFSGRSVAVTGGGSGIGAATARAFAALGARVGVLDLDEAGAEAVATEIGDAAMAIALDVADAEAVTQALDRLAEVQGGLDVLVSNAGILRAYTMDDMGPQDWARVLATNLSGPFHCLHAALPHLRASAQAGRGPAVINVASTTAKSISRHGGIDYTASKSGILGLTRHAAYELGPSGIRVVTVCPGPTLTSMVAAHNTEERLAATARMIPLGRWVQPEEIADVILFFASRHAAMCTGTCIEVDGGSLISNGVAHDDYLQRRGG